MGRLFSMMGSMIACVAIATLLAQGVGGAYLWSTGKLSPQKCLAILAVVHDIETNSDSAGKDEKTPDQSSPSYEQISQQRTIQSRLLDLKAQALEKGLDEVRHERTKLTTDKDRFELQKTTFTEELDKRMQTAKETGFANVRLIWENIPSKLAKEQIQKMVENDEIEDVVVILADMPIAKRAKIVKAFTSEEEVEMMDRILRLIREGEPESSLIEQARKQTLTN